MADELQVVRASAEQAAWMRDRAAQLEQLVLDAFGGLVGKRLAWWRAFEGVTGKFDVNVDELVGIELVGENIAANRSTEALLTIVKALYSGEAELVGVEQHGRMHLAAVKKGSVPRPLEALPLVPLVVVAGLTTLTYLAFDVWASFKKAEQEAQKADASNQAKKLELLAKAQQQGPGAVAQLGAIIKQIDDSAADKQRSLLDQLKRLAQQVGSAVADVGSATKTAAEWSPLAIAALVYVVYRWSKSR